MKEFSFCTEKLRIAFPRLYFVTDDDVIRMMSVIRSPQHFIPIAKKCFPSIETMRFELPSDFQNSANIALDYQLNGVYSVGWLIHTPYIHTVHRIVVFHLSTNFFAFVVK